MKKLTIGLIGNPNSGKTTLFNQLTGARQRVGNWAGVTVERKEGQFSTTDHQVTLVDLPGTYSLTTISSQTSLDEQIACHYILSGDADLLINVVDASNLERNLYLTLQLLELGIPCIVALNMLDIAEKQNIRIEIDALSARLGCPVIPLVSTRGRGIEALKLAIDRYKANENVELVHYAQPLLNEADSLAKVMPSDIPLKQRRWLGLQMLEGDTYHCPYGGAVIASGILFYCIQLYCDFSGGIDITRGVARMFGIDMAENFRRPIFAMSLTEYWRRWHITLGAWMRDYVFYPRSLSKAFGRLSRWARTHIRGTGGKIFATSLATFIVYLIIGIWHGANFRYIAFGLWNGVLITASLLLERTFLRWKAALHINDKSAAWRVFMTLRTMLLVFIGRYFTRSPRLSCVFRFLKTTVLHPQPSQLLDGTLLSFGLAKTDFLVIALGLAVLLTLECLQERGVQIRAALEKKSGFVQWLTVTALLLAVLLLGVFRAGYIPSGFIYTQF